MGRERGGEGSVFHFTIKAETASASPISMLPGSIRNCAASVSLSWTTTRSTAKLSSDRQSAWGMVPRETGSPRRPFSGYVAAMP